MRIYLMARYGRRLEMLQRARELQALGHEVVSRWVFVDAEAEDERLNRDQRFIEWEGAIIATNDLFDLTTADCAIAFTEAPGAAISSRGSRHFEAGVAYTIRGMQIRMPETVLPFHGPLRLIQIGPLENIFYTLPSWQRFPDWPACLTALRAEKGVEA